MIFHSSGNEIMVEKTIIIPKINEAQNKIFLVLLAGLGLKTIGIPIIVNPTTRKRDLIFPPMT